MSDKRECILCDQELPNTQTYDDSIVKKVAVDLFDNCKLRDENTTLKAKCDKYEDLLRYIAHSGCPISDCRERALKAITYEQEKTDGE